MPGQLAERTLGVRAQLYPDLEVAQSTAQHAYDFLVGAQHQRFQAQSCFHDPGTPLFRTLRSLRCPSNAGVSKRVTVVTRCPSDATWEGGYIGTFFLLNK